MFRPKLTGAALAAVGLVALAAPASAAPVLSSTAALSQAATAATNVEQVQWRGHRHGGWGGGRALAGAGIGFATGAIVGSAIANSNRGYYGQPYGYGGAYAYDPGYDGAYAYDPGYAAPRYYGNRVNDYCARYDSSGVNRFDNCY
jgi:hypothetical protein